MKLYLAPMEGITTFVYRNALQHYYGGIDKYFTPFLCNKKLDYKDKNDVAPENNDKLYIVPQILTNQADTFLSIANQLADRGYQEVNLNLGCPSGTVTAKKRGAGFLAVPDLLDAFLEEIFDKCPLSISIKTRIGVESLEEWEALCRIYAKYPLKELIIHTRLQKEYYNGVTHPQAFVQASDILPVPLCYNGDLFSTETFSRLEQELSLAGVTPSAVMLGRGIITDPALAQKLISADLSSTAKSADTTKDSVAHTGSIQTFRAFHDEILAGYIELMSGEQPVLYRMKELWAYMAHTPLLSGRVEPTKIIKKVRKTNRLADYRSVISEIL